MTNRNTSITRGTLVNLLKSSIYEPGISTLEAIHSSLE